MKPKELGQMSKHIVVVKVSAGHDNNGIPRRLYIVKELDTESRSHVASHRLAIIEEGYEGWGAVSKRYPTAMLIEDIYTTPQEYRRWIKVMKNDQKLRDQEALEKYEEERTNQ
jgi:hypothetical protein